MKELREVHLPNRVILWGESVVGRLTTNMPRLPGLEMTIADGMITLSRKGLGLYLIPMGQVAAIHMMEVAAKQDTNVDKAQMDALARVRKEAQAKRRPKAVSTLRKGTGRHDGRKPSSSTQRWVKRSVS